MEVRRGFLKSKEAAQIFPALLWLTAFGATKLLPLLLRMLSMRFPLYVDPPTVFPETGEPPVDHSHYAYTPREIADMASALAAYPVGMWRHIRSVLQATEPTTSVLRRVLTVLVTAFTSQIVHPTRSAMASSVFNYLYTICIGRQQRTRREVVVDLAAACLSTGVVNTLMQFLVPALTMEGRRRAPAGASIMKHSTLRALLRPLASPFPLLSLLSIFSSTNLGSFMSVRAGSGDPVTGWDGSALPSNATVLDDWSIPPTQREAAARSSLPSSYASSTTTTSPSPHSGGGTAQDTAPAGDDAAHRTPFAAFVCGGDGFNYALAGFRYVYRDDSTQLRGAAWSYWIDMSRILTQLRETDVERALERAHSVAPNLSPNAQASGRAVSSSSSSPYLEGYPNTRPPPRRQRRSSSSPPLRVIRDVFLTPGASVELQLSLLMCFGAGMLAGSTLKHRREIASLARRLPVVSFVWAWLWPPPPAPIPIPEELMAIALSDQEFVRVCVPMPVRLCRNTSVAGEEDDAVSVASHATRSAAVHTVAVVTPGASHGEENESHRPHETASSPPSRAGDGEREAKPTVLASTEIPVSSDCFCAITRSLMSDPVTTVDGFTYERSAIEEWLSERETAPMTNLPLDSVKLTPNWAVRAKVEHVVKAYEDFVKSVNALGVEEE